MDIMISLNIAECQAIIDALDAENKRVNAIHAEHGITNIEDAYTVLNNNKLCSKIVQELCKAHLE